VNRGVRTGLAAAGAVAAAAGAVYGAQRGLVATLRRRRGGHEAVEVEPEGTLTVVTPDAATLHVVTGGAGQPVVFLHGFALTAQAWAPQLVAVAGAGYHAVAYDARGHGASSTGFRGFSRELLADDLAAVLEALDLHDVVLVGHSLGGVTITETAYQHPERVAHLVYVGALVPPRGASAAIVMTGSDLPPGPMAPMDETRAKALFGNDLSDQQWDDHWRTVVPDAAGIMNARLSGYPTGTPITYIGMTDDVPVPPALADQMVANLGPGVDRRTIDAGHTVMLAKPAELAAIIEEVVARASAPA
jgi:pimeloyl-ACP methyl ester carboxylesterase